MRLRIVYGKAGTGKSQFCFDEIANLIKREKKIYIITPEQFSFTAEKKLMDKLDEGAVFNAEVITFDRMAYRILNEVGGLSNMHLSKSGKAMLIYHILNKSKNKLKFLGKSDENVQICLNAINEFKKHNVQVDTLKKEIDATDDKYLKIKLNDITTIYENFENQITENYIDDADLLTILAEKIDQTDMFKNSVIYIDEFMGFTAQEYNIIRQMLTLAKQVTITVCTDNLKTTENPDADVFYSNKITISKLIELVGTMEDISTVKLEELHRFKNEELKHLEENLYSKTYEKYEGVPKDIQLFLAKNQYSEIENVAKNIVKKVRDEHYRYRDIAIITKNIDIYSSQIRAIFGKYDIPVFIDEKRELNQNPVIQYLLSILEIFIKNWSHESVFNYIKTGFLKLSLEDIFNLENYCIKWGIKYNKWAKDFTLGMEEEAEKQEVERLNEIRKQIVEPLAKLKANIKNEKTAKNISKELYKFLVDQDIEMKLQDKIKSLEALGLIDIANEYKESYKIFIQLLDEITLLFEEEALTFEKYVDILKVGLKNSGLGKIPQLADQVTVGDVDRSRSHKLKIVYIIGLNDGVFPNPNKDEGFLNDNDRNILKSDGIELAKGTIDQLYEDNFNIYKATTTAEENLYLSYASSDSEGKSLRPSILISKIKRLYPELHESSDIISTNQEILTKSTTYDELIENINRLENGENIDKIWYSMYEYFKNDEIYTIRLKQDLQGLKYTNMPSQINKETVEKLYGNTLNTSISKLEKYRSCPFSYYLQYGLKLKKREQLKIQSIDTGTFMHETIEQFFDTIKEENIELYNITDEEIDELVNRLIDERLDLTKNYIFTSTAKYKLLTSRLKRIVAKSIKYIIQTLTQSNFEILGTEVEFGRKGEYEPILLELGDGKKVEITGKIDRIDFAKNGDDKYLRIIDYKSSAKNIDLNEVYAGLQIQLITYLDAVCKEEDAMAAGILYFSLIEQMIKADRKMNAEEIEEKIKANFKMKGLILADVKLVKMHDKTLDTGASKIVPAYIDKSGNLSKKTSGVTKEEFEDLQKYIYKIIKDISKEILKGKIELKPYYKKGNTPCKYCSYKPICGFNKGFCNNDYNYIKNDSKDKVLEKIKGKKTSKQNTT